jgi:UDP-N-acetylglucosamine 2-epimerase (non-hydrolysing)
VNPKKILVVVGTRPNFIKITQFEKVISKYRDKLNWKLIHTGQHFDYNMSDIFFSQLKIKKPDYFLGIKADSANTQMALIMIELEKVFKIENPDWVIVVGDVNSTFAAAFAAYKTGIKVAHLESGLRSNDREMPEEINRILTDEISNLFFVTEQSGVENLLKTGKSESQIKLVGNTMIDTLVAYDAEIDKSDILEKLDIENQKYALVTIHRPSNVDEKESLNTTLDILKELSKKIKVVFPIHPRTLKNVELFGFKSEIEQNQNIIITPPLDYFAFQKLIKKCTLVLTDSGGIQEETTYRQIPCLTLRKNTERPITTILGTNTLIEFEKEKIMSQVNNILSNQYKKGQIPPLWDGNATQRIIEIFL